MKKIKVADITNETIRKALTDRKLPSAFIVAKGILRPDMILYYMPYGSEVIDAAGTAIWSDHAEFATLKAKLLEKPVLLRDVLKSLRGFANKKAIVKIQIGDTVVPVAKCTIDADGVILING